VHGVRGFYRGDGVARSGNGRWCRRPAGCGARVQGWSPRGRARRFPVAEIGETTEQGLAAACGPPARSPAARAGPGSRGVPGQRRGRQDRELPQGPEVTDRTALDVNAGDAQHQVPGRLWLDGRWGRLRQERPALSERSRAGKVGAGMLTVGCFLQILGLMGGAAPRYNYGYIASRAERVGRAPGNRT